MTDDKLAVSQEAQECANRCIPPAVIFAEDERHVADLRRRAGEHIARFEAQARLAGERAGKWQDIASAPKDGTWVLCWGPDCLHGIARFDPNPIWAEYPEYTHWMPLPEPPAILKEAASITPEPNNE